MTRNLKDPRPAEGLSTLCIPKRSVTTSILDINGHQSKNGLQGKHWALFRPPAIRRVSRHDAPVVAYTNRKINQAASPSSGLRHRVRHCGPTDRIRGQPEWTTEPSTMEPTRILSPCSRRSMIVIAGMRLSAKARPTTPHRSHTENEGKALRKHSRCQILRTVYSYGLPERSTSYTRWLRIEQLPRACFSMCLQRLGGPLASRKSMRAIRNLGSPSGRHRRGHYQMEGR